MISILIKNDKDELFNGLKLNLTEAMDNGINYNVLLTEELDKNDISIIEKLIDKKMNKTEMENKIKAIVVKELGGKDNEKIVLQIVKNCMVQLYKQLWSKRSFWMSGIVNSAT